MKHRVSRAPYLIAGLVALAVVGAAVYRVATRGGSVPAGETAVGEGEIVLADSSERVAGITLDVARLVQRTDRFEAPGVLALNDRRTARIGSMVEGVVVATTAEVGDRVARGSVVAELHSPVVHVAWADYRNSIAERRQAETELAFSEEATARARRLFAEKALSQQALSRAEADRVMAVERLEMARTEVRRAEEALEHYGVTNAEDPSGESGESIPVRSPLAGVVLERTVTRGSAVTPGQLLYVVSDLSSLWAIADVAEDRLAEVRPGLPVSLRVAAYAGETFGGTITFVGDVINPKTRRVTVRCEVPNPDGKLKPEMYASLSLGTGRPRPALVVPGSAIQELEGRPMVFVRDDSGVFRRRDVVLGVEHGGLVEVREGLREGEKVAAAGSFLLKSELLKGTLAEE